MAAVTEWRCSTNWPRRRIRRIPLRRARTSRPAGEVRLRVAHAGSPRDAGNPRRQHHGPAGRADPARELPDAGLEQLAGAVAAAKLPSLGECQMRGDPRRPRRRLIAFSTLIAAQFLSIVFASQVSSDTRA